MSNVKLKPCHHCGDEGVLMCETFCGIPFGYFVECDGCFDQTETFHTEELAVEAWNKRVIEQESEYMKIEVADNYVVVDGIFYYREQGDACQEQENVCHPKKRGDKDYRGNDCHDCSKCGAWLPQPSDSAIRPVYCMWCGAKVIY